MTFMNLTPDYNLVITDPKQIPQWLGNGIIYLLPNSGKTNNPKSHLPITCLITMYKMLPSILTAHTHLFLFVSGLFPGEQKGCECSSYGCKDQLLINRMILENCHNRNNNLSIAWIDYKKAFDSVPDS